MIVRIVSDYSDGSCSSVLQIIEGPEPTAPRRATRSRPPATDPFEAWWEDVVSPLTGDGTGIDSSLGWCYEATIIQADDPKLEGLNREWVGS